ncbi:MAG: glycosyltransferase family 2 protein [Candidatus Omnitrophica bacterium]|jgi:glycosyltransferase involved in cell wall biosynthesis|nr:glycosyltransferase family 2 protein [Candidatus Omnitrophota bacterium]MDD5080116.1 glycosyltransferase family 2 protein [Candidatus Omnitrophota bacterium]
MFLSILIPVYNEEKTIEAVVDMLGRVPFSIDKEVILVDDGSQDNTRGVIETKLRGRVDKVIYHKKNLGKGAAVRTAIQQSSGGVLAIHDADLEYNPFDLPRLIDPVIRGEADVVYGSRLLDGGSVSGLSLFYRLGNIFLTAVSNMFTRLRLTDMETCYKVFSRAVLEKISIEEEGFGFDAEITAKAAKVTPRITERAISYIGRSHAAGKKNTWQQGFRVIFCIVKYGIFRDNLGC